jgi:uncharacterized protein (DUF2062 family)
MCPMCVGSAVAYFAGGTSAGGLALWVVRVFKQKRVKREQ